jgi:nitrate reductase assembly molybdenum cofactor insertion protein NarJ
MDTKLYKKDLIAFLDRLENTAEKFKTARFTELFKFDTLNTPNPLWAADELHDLNSAFAQAMVELLDEYHQIKREKAHKAYHDGGYYQVFKGRNQYTKPFDR